MAPKTAKSGKSGKHGKPAKPAKLPKTEKAKKALIAAKPAKKATAPKSVPARALAKKTLAATMPKAPQKATAPAKGGKPAPKVDKMDKTDKAANEQRIKHALKKLTGGAGKNTPAIFKVPSKKNTPMVFSLGEVRQLIKEKGSRTPAEIVATAGKIKTTAQRTEMAEVTQKPRTLKRATLDDLLGGSPKQASLPALMRDESEVPAKWLPYYKKLVALRDKLVQSVSERSEQTLRSSSKDAAGDLSSYSQHIADAGTDAFDTDFALSLVSSDQEMLREVEAAIGRVFDGTYGVCEVTHKPIGRDRLNAVPFTRFSKEGQDQFERTRRRSSQRVGIASAEDDDATAVGSDEDES